MAMCTQHGSIPLQHEVNSPMWVICSSNIPSFPDTLPDPPGPMSLMVRALDLPLLGFEHKPIFDLCKSNFLERRFLVSRSRTTNLGDLVNHWKKQVLATNHSQIELADDNVDV